MTQSAYGLDITFKAENDLSGNQYAAVKLGTNAGEVDVAGTTDLAVGILQNKPEAGEAARVRLYGTTKVEAAAAFSRGDQLMIADAAGRVDTATALDAAWNGTVVNVVGIALEAAGATGDIVEMLIAPCTYGT